MKTLRGMMMAVLLLFTVSTAAENRRTFIILQDDSGSYYKFSEKYRDSLERSLVSLFCNNPVEDKYSRLAKEQEQNIRFFDQSRDDVIFLRFVADSVGNAGFRKSDSTYQQFEDYFFKKQDTMSFRNSGLPDISDFFVYNFGRHVGANTKNGDGKSGPYSFTSFAYPLCLDVVDTDYSSEYIVIVISDFQVGSTFGNMLDKNQFLKVFDTLRTQRVCDRISWLKGRFNKWDYYDFDIPISSTSLIGYNAFRIKPNAGLPNPENMSVRINSDIRFKQNVYGEDVYTLDTTKIMFRHSDNLKTDKIEVQVILPSSDTVSREIVDFAVADGVYSIPALSDLKLDGLLDKESCFDCDLRYVFYTSYSLSRDSLDDNHHIKYIFETERSINLNNYTLLKKLSLVEMLLLAVSVLIVTGLLLYCLRNILTSIKYSYGINEDYEDVDFTKSGFGKIRLDYWPWETQQINGKLEIRVDCQLYRDIFKKNLRIEKCYDATFCLDSVTIPNGFEAEVEVGNRLIDNDAGIVPLDNIHFEDGSFSFSFIITKKVQVTDPVLFKLKATIEYANFYVFRKRKDVISYDFFLGPDLGNVWIGVDPGTTGSCIAAATRPDNLVIEQKLDNIQNQSVDRVTPSVIHVTPFDLVDIDRNDINSVKNKIRENTIFGDLADKIEDQTNKFVSIKKLIGYNNIQKIETTRQDEFINIKPTFLSTLIIEGLLNEQKKYIEKEQYPDLISNGRFEPKRAVFAIPNNFTATKIQKLKESILDVKDSTIKEIRFIYEAEAILVNYIKNDKRNVEKRNSDGEIVFIFDMGGATINVTVAKVKHSVNEGKYDIEIITKLGYAVGGDNIDYAYIKWIYSQKDRFKALYKTDPFRNMNGDNRDDSLMKERRALKEAVLDLKLSTINNFNNDAGNLLSLKDFTEFNRELESDTVKDAFMAECVKNGNSFLYNPIFEEIVYDNINSILHDAVTICESRNLPPLNTVILAGRSSHFPRVTEYVKNVVPNAINFIILSMEESKSAVAKGACYYGTMRRNIIFHNRTVSGTFGVIQTHGMNNPKFIPLIHDGQEFDNCKADSELLNVNNIASGSFSIINDNNCRIYQNFGDDNGEVRFCQVMGTNPQKIIENDEKRKYSIVASTVAVNDVAEVSMQISDRDKVKCALTYVGNNRKHDLSGVINDSDMKSDNDEAYTFFVNC